MADSISNGSENEEVADYLSLNYEKNLIFFQKKNLSSGFKIIRQFVKEDRTEFSQGQVTKNQPMVVLV